MFEAKWVGALAALLAVAGCAPGQTMRLLLPGAQSSLLRTTKRTTDDKKEKAPLCAFLPLRDVCRAQLDNETDRITFINRFYQTFSNISFMGQVKSIYNGTASAAVVSADLASLNFTPGMELTVTTNIVAGSSGATGATGATGAIIVADGTPTLTTAEAGQATQNVLTGGTVVASVIYPLIAVGAANVTKAGAFGLSVDLAGREGVDIQDFKAGTSTTASSPSSHTNSGIEGYMYLNATNNTSNSNMLAGALFLGGSYGFNYMSHDYARDYGFGDRVRNGVGQISFGILLNGVAKISVSRGFGPSQAYFDSTTMTQRTVNNFKSWSIGITYQSPAPAN